MSEPSLPPPQPQAQLDTQQVLFQSPAEVFGLCLASTWMSLTSTLRTAPLFRVKVLLMAEKEALASGQLSSPYSGIWGCIKAIYQAEGIRGFWRGCHIGWLQAGLSHMTNIPLFYGWIPFNFLRTTGILVDPYLHGVLYAMVWDFLLYPLELAYLLASADAPGSTEDDSVHDDAASEAVVTNSGAVSKQPKRRGGLLAFFQNTYDKRGVAGLFNGYQFTLSRMFMRWCGHLLLVSPLVRDKQGLGIGLSVSIGLLAHANHVVHTRYVVRARSKSVGPYHGMEDCVRSISKEGALAFLSGLHWAILAAFIDQIVQGILEGVTQTPQG
eukprot:GGOE01014061.1.p1 GENE.GGOE01014061.1~~GGOE01014061.1.p1  ORF type:complete len:333 (+),score=72.04 GGOE01014061.1:23-1000(+)